MMRNRYARGFAAGAVAGGAALLTLFGYRYATGMPTFPEALAERMIRLLPYQFFALILARLQHLAKPFGLVMAIATTLIGFALGGVLFAWVTRRTRLGRLRLALATMAVTWLVLTYVLLPFIEGGILGVPLTTVVSAPALPMALASAVYGGLLVLLLGVQRSNALEARGERRPPSAPPVRARRDVLRRSALILVAAAAGTRWVTWMGSAASWAAAATGQAFRLIKGMPPEVTPTPQFYQVSKNFFDPTVDVAKWTLEVTGLVSKPLKLSLAEFIKAAPAVERHQTFECISNEVGGDLIGTAKWKCVRVKDILALAGVKPGAKTVIWHSADGYTESIPLSIADDPASLLAYEMNGEPIPQKHGAPVRVLLTNRYGMKQPKWLTTIEVSDKEYRSTKGYWEQQGWSQDAIVKTNSAFRVETKEGPALALGGWAFAGNRGISKVEFSGDGGKTWLPAAVKEPLGENCWQLWSATWTPPGPGDYSIKVRAVDGKGALQAEEPKPTLPDGAQGYHTVRVHFG
jgi:DMSO/TMAO reductase YedYZ molybdopterin-dependent catalytic subunit